MLEARESSTLFPVRIEFVFQMTTTCYVAFPR
jgi:hypothetical protein